MNFNKIVKTSTAIMVFSVIAVEVFTISKTAAMGSISSQGMGTSRLEITADSLRLFNHDGTYEDFVRIR